MDSGKKTKIIFGVVLLPLAFWLLGWAPPTLLLVVVLVLGAGLGSYELAQMLFREAGWYDKSLLIIMSLFLCLATQTGETELMGLALCIVALISCVAFLFREKDLAKVLPSASKVVMGSIYIGMFAGMVVALRRMEPGLGGSKLVLILFALTWVNDAGAFFVGSKFGNKKLWPAISPGKTWAGFYGGVACSIIMALLIAWYSPVWRLRDALYLGVLFALIAPLGDLFESAIKRGAGVKDSGVFLPGHGGILDRIDSILFMAPILFFYATIVGPGRVAG